MKISDYIKFTKDGFQKADGTLCPTEVMHRAELETLLKARADRIMKDFDENCESYLAHDDESASSLSALFDEECTTIEELLLQSSASLRACSAATKFLEKEVQIRQRQAMAGRSIIDELKALLKEA